MTKVNIEAELLANHTDEEIIEYMDGIMTGVIKNYKTSLTANQPAVLWGNLGDLSLVTSLLRGMKRRNIARQTPQSEV